ncbi:hypothetical protein RI129_001404 [Pyrocoelia pectoralis]|uniref:pyruvate dehydrogenase (acetyl-transferring) n=1 Tax=Pyrocoelia pectoralis TaxID=417401 RepID=A0AAN7ZJZ7_9COLE
MLPSCVYFINKLSLANLKAFLSCTKTNYATDVKLDTKPYQLHKLDQPPASSTTLSKADAVLYYTQLQSIRRLEASADNLYKSKMVRGFCHLYAGEEAVAVGIRAALRPSDAVITSYRDHGWAYLMGVNHTAILAELTGRQKGCVRGKGGSMHLYTKNFYGGNGIVGAQVPLGVGVALALKYTGTTGVCVALYGDGAANQGQLFEAFNIAKLWNIPCICVCENNGYGMGTSSARAAANVEYYKRGDYIPGLRIDGMDILTVREAARYALDYCASGKGPLLIESVTYSYRTKDEIQQVRQTRDPITLFKEKITSSNLVSAEEIKKIDDEIKSEIDQATNVAKSDAEAGVDELTADIYANNLESTIRNCLPFNPLSHKRIGEAVNL